MDWFLFLMCLNNHFDPVEMKGPFTARTTNPQGAKNLTNFFLHIYNFNLDFVVYMIILYSFIGVPQLYTRNFKSCQAKLKV